MEVIIDKQLKEECNVNLGCIFYKTNVIKTNKELWEHIEKEVSGCDYCVCFRCRVYIGTEYAAAV